MVFTVFDLFACPPDQDWKNAIVEDGEVHVRFDDLPARVRGRAVHLSMAGLSAGDRVLIACPNSVDWIISTLAVMRLRAIAVPINPGATDREIQLYEQIAEPSGVILGPGGDADRFRATALYTDGAAEDAGEEVLGLAPSGQDRALILFTSGTTGAPKAAVQQHSVLVDSGQGIVHWLGITKTDRILLCMPMFHANAIYYSLMGSLCAGASMAVRPRFSVSKFWAMIRGSGATVVNLMGPMLSMLLQSQPQQHEREHPLRLVYTAACLPDVAIGFAKRFGVEVIEGYGMTETPYGCINPRDHPRLGSVGLPRQHPSGKFRNDVRILGPDGLPVEEREVGEIVIKNDATFAEYWGDPSATRDALSKGWLRTGDLGYKDDAGYIYVVGRAKEIIRRNGVNISPTEIESVTRHIPEVDDAALVGLPSPLGEELAILAVKVSRTASIEGVEDRVLSRLRALVSREKMPDRIVVVDDIPKTSTHRIQRGKLQECLRKKGIANQTAARR